MVIVDDEIAEEGGCEEAGEGKKIGEGVDVFVPEGGEFRFYGCT